MPKRILDGEGLWFSKKLSRVQPPSFRPEYANMLPLALANGTFECSPREVWSKVYSFNRPEIKPETVSKILDEFEHQKLLFRWLDETGREWGYWVGIEKRGRLPSDSRQKDGHEKKGIPVPIDLLSKFLVNHNDTNGYTVATQQVATPEQVPIPKPREPVDTQGLANSLSKSKKPVRFRPPSVEEVRHYMKELAMNDPDGTAKKFIDYYEVRGWIPGRSRQQMKSWKAAVRTWKTNEKSFSSDPDIFQETMPDLGDPEDYGNNQHR
jgi:hypothetical protein